MEKSLPKRKEPLTAQELKATGILLNETDIDSYADVDYEPTIIKFRELRDKFKTISENTRVRLAKRLFYEKLAKHMDYRIDLLNIEHGFPVETNSGHHILSYTKRGISGSMHRFWEYVKANKYGIAVGVLSSIPSSIFTFVYVASTKTSQVIIKVIEKVVVPAAVAAGPVIGTTIINTALEIPKFLLWLSEHAVSFTIGAISFSIAAYKEYGEESVFPILAFWAYILAMSMYVLHYVEETYKSAKRYIPFTGH